MQPALELTARHVILMTTSIKKEIGVRAQKDDYVERQNRPLNLHKDVSSVKRLI